MLIFCTKDEDLIAAWDGSTDWGTVFALDPNLNQGDATDALQQLLGQLQANEALCIAAHGNDTEIGDDGNQAGDWEWTTADIASYLDAAGVGGNWKAPAAQGAGSMVLFQVCCTNVANFSAGVAVELEDLVGVAFSVWCYGYNTAVAFASTLPSPAQLTTNVSLQGTHAYHA